MFAFPSQAAFQYVRLMLIRGRQSEIQFSRISQNRRFTVFVYNRNLWYFPSMPKASQYGIDRIKIPWRVLHNWNLASMDGRHVMIKWI